MNHELARAAETWNRIVTDPAPKRSRFWHSPNLTALVDQRWRRETGYNTPVQFICGESGRNHFAVMLSIGCGAAANELKLLQEGIVDRIILCDISDAQLQLARNSAKNFGLDEARIEFRNFLDFSNPSREKIDLIYWQQSLHHMFDTEAAIAWCLDALQGQGAMYYHDACPPNRIQWPSDAIDWVERFRSALPRRYLASDSPTWWHPARREPESVEYWLEVDPTECADSANIIPAIRKLAPQTRLHFLGGLIYGYAMHDILSNFDEDLDRPLFEFAMLVDELLSKLGYNYFFTGVTAIHK